jgi:hypothetical protein
VEVLCFSVLLIDDDPIFSDTGHTGLESKITSFVGRKTGLIIAFLLADRRSDGLG